MSLENLAIVKTNDLPIRHVGDVHNGKVRSVYWLSPEDSNRLADKGIGRPNTDKGAMVISDRISAFECKWQTEGGLQGVPGKGASLNAISKHWFDGFEENGLAGNHILANPHPLVWIVEKAEPVMLEAIGRQYITGSMWRAYDKGAREFCGIQLPEGLKKDQRLDELLITPSTKGILRGIPGIPEKDDVNVTRQQILDNYQAFGFKSIEDVNLYEKLLTEGFQLISRELDTIGKVFVDTKYEFGYVPINDGSFALVYIDELGTPDSSRYWDKELYEKGTTVEESKEAFRQDLLDNVPDRDILLNKNRMDERVELAATYKVPDKVFMDTSDLYKGLAEKITGKPVPEIENAKEEILESLAQYNLVA
tara:strand:+ start:1762 stop:2856 length:1095 start_codon:yes stop_codon:yes gene_type:complete